MKINLSQFNKEVRTQIKAKIQGLLTPEEFAQVEFGQNYKWTAPEEIMKKIQAGLKAD
jgi:hypothetical protein